MERESFRWKSGRIRKIGLIKSFFLLQEEQGSWADDGKKRTGG